jgi:hypothetical protein
LHRFAAISNTIGAARSTPDHRLAPERHIRAVAVSAQMTAPPTQEVTMSHRHRRRHRDGGSGHIKPQDVATPMPAAKSSASASVSSDAADVSDAADAKDD